MRNKLKKKNDFKDGEFIGKESNFNYYDITDGWNNKVLNKAEDECQELCIQNVSCIFAIHFYQNQYQGSDNTKSRKPLNASANTCILRNELNLQYGTKKDSSCNIFYLTSNVFRWCFYSQ